jgi:hypothetical protein
MLDTMLQWRFERRQPGQSVLTARLLDAMTGSGCPLCRVAGRATQHHLESLLDERVTLPEAHARLLRSRGFCTAHTWALPTAALAAQSARGVALLYAPLLNDLLRHWPDPARRRRWFAPERPCPVCQILDRTEPAYRAELLLLLRGGHAIPVLCQPHLRALAPHAPPELRARLATAATRAQGEGTAAERLALLVGARPAHLFGTAPDCPACAAGAGAARAVAPARGLCRDHAWSAFATAGSALVGALAVAPPATAGCPACRAAHAAAGALTGRRAAHRLCLAHLHRRLAAHPATGEIAFWSIIQLQRDLVRFIDAGRGDFRGHLTAAEQRSWLTALGRFGGEMPGAGITPAGVPPGLRPWRWRHEAVGDRYGVA